MSEEKSTPVGPNPDGPGERVGPHGDGGNQGNPTEGGGEVAEERELTTAQAALQAAQQAVQAARQATQQAEQAVQTAQQASRGVGAETSGATVETEITPASIGRAWAANNKRTYDEFQDISLVAARRSQLDYDRISAVSLQALQNAVETANKVGKQAVRHAELAIDRQWGMAPEESAAISTLLRGIARQQAGRPDDVVGEDD